MFVVFDGENLFMFGGELIGFFVENDGCCWRRMKYGGEVWSLLSNYYVQRRMMVFDGVNDGVC